MALRTGAVTIGLLGALVGLSAAGYALVVYLVEGTNGMANPYASRMGFGVAAFLLAALAGVGAFVVLARPLHGSVLLMMGSLLGLVAISLFSINTWYVLAVPLCMLGAILALASAPRPTSSVTVQWLSLALMVAVAVAAYFVAGILAALAVALLAVVALVLLLPSVART